MHSSRPLSLTSWTMPTTASLLSSLRNWTPSPNLRSQELASQCTFLSGAQFGRVLWAASLSSGSCDHSWERVWEEACHKRGADRGHPDRLAHTGRVRPSQPHTFLCVTSSERAVQSVSASLSKVLSRVSHNMPSCTSQSLHLMRYFWMSLLYGFT